MKDFDFLVREKFIGYEYQPKDVVNGTCAIKWFAKAAQVPEMEFEELFCIDFKNIDNTKTCDEMLSENEMIKLYLDKVQIITGNFKLHDQQISIGIDFRKETPTIKLSVKNTGHVDYPLIEKKLGLAN